MDRFFTFGHSTLQADVFRATLRASNVAVAADVRRFPGSRRHPQFGADAMREWLGLSAIAYRPMLDLGGRREPLPDSPNAGLRNSGFRGYADYMRTPGFRAAFDALLTLTREQTVAIFCAETLWWQCHRRLIADAAVLLAGFEVTHLTPSGRSSHVITPGAVAENGYVAYPGTNAV